MSQAGEQFDLRQGCNIESTGIEPVPSSWFAGRLCVVTGVELVVLKAIDEQSLISRSTHPRHPNVFELHITDAGRETLHAALQQVEPVERSVIGAFSPKELEALAALLNRLIAATEA